MKDKDQPNAILPPIDVEVVGASTPRNVVGQEGWQNLEPFQKKVLANYPPGRRGPHRMFALLQATRQVWNDRIGPLWDAEKVRLYSAEGGEAETLRLEREINQWLARLDGYRKALDLYIPFKRKAPESLIYNDVIVGLLLRRPGAAVVPDFMFPLYLQNQINVLQAAQLDNRKYLGEQIIHHTREVTQWLYEGGKDIVKAATDIMSPILTPVLLSVVAGVTVYYITRRGTRVK